MKASLSQSIQKRSTSRRALGRLAEYSAKRGKSLSEFSKKNIRHMVLIGAGCFLLGIFGTLSYQLFGDTESASAIRSVDERIMAEIVQHRKPLLTQSAVDITALGSVTIITLISLVFIGGFALTKDYLGMIQLSTAAAGGGLWMLFLKGLVERERPDIANRLVEVTGFSYPSGHSLSAAAFYLSFAFMAARHMDKFGKRAGIFGLAFLIVFLVASSRVYLGVHYPSDVLSGILFGTSWAITVEAIVAYVGRKSIKEQVAVATAKGGPRNAPVPTVPVSDTSA